MKKDKIFKMIEFIENKINELPKTESQNFILFKMIEFFENKINELPRPLNQTSRKEYNLYINIISTLKEFANID